MNVYKFKANRLSFSFGNYFIKITKKKKDSDLNDAYATLGNTVVQEILCELIAAHCPKTLFFKRIFSFYIEGAKKIKNAAPLKSEEQKEFFYQHVQNALPSASKNLASISWAEILPPKVLRSIQDEEKSFKYIRDALDSIEYFRTGMHGDLNPNNVLIDSDRIFWIVDWENNTPNGSIAWDLHWFYGIWQRDTSAPYDDILSIFEKSKKPPKEIKETLLIYSLMKLRLELFRHQRDIDLALKGFERRISAIIKVC